jgi:cell division protein FtsW
MGLVATGVVMVVSAQVVKSPVATSALRQLLLATLGVLAMFAAMRTDYHHLRRPAVIWTLIAVAVVGLVLVFFFDKRNGAHRWIEVFGQTVQPSELAKLAAIVFTAAVLERRMHRINDVKYSLMPIALVVGPLAFLIVKEPDLGTSAVVVLIVAAMAYAAGLSARYMVGGFLLMLPLLTYYIVAYGFHLDRVLAFLGLGNDPLGVDYQLNHSKMALGSGGVFGRGLNESLQKLHFMPEAHNDFIFFHHRRGIRLIGATALVGALR